MLACTNINTHAQKGTHSYIHTYTRTLTHSLPPLEIAVEINEVFKKYTRHPVLAIIDVQPQDEMSIPVDAYVAVEEVKDVRAQNSQKISYLAPLALPQDLYQFWFGRQEHMTCDNIMHKPARYILSLP